MASISIPDNELAKNSILPTRRLHAQPIISGTVCPHNSQTVDLSYLPCRRNMRRQSQPNPSLYTDSCNNTPPCSSMENQQIHQPHILVNYADANANVDTLFQQYQRERNYVIGLLLNDPRTLAKVLWSGQSPLSIDNNCLCHLAQNNQNSYNIMAETFNCGPCRTLGRLTNLNKYVVGDKFSIESGKKMGRCMYITSVNPGLFFISVNQTPICQLQRLVNNNYLKCEPDLASEQNNLFLGCDPFTNELIVNWLLQIIFRNQPLQTINNSASSCNGQLSAPSSQNVTKFSQPAIIYTGFVCRRTGFLLKSGKYMTIPELFAEENVNIMPDAGYPQTNLARNMTVQLIAMLHHLKHYGFSHGDANIKALVFSKHIGTITHDNYAIAYEYKLHLDRLRYSSIAITNNNGEIVRMYNSSEQANVLIAKQLYQAQIQTHNMGDERSVYYRFSSCQAYTFFLQIRHMGLAIHRSSYDLYAFWLALMLYRPYRQAISRDENMMKIWRSLWLISDYNSIENIIEEHMSDNSQASKKIVHFLSDKWLRCNAIKYVWEQVKCLSSD